MNCNEIKPKKLTNSYYNFQNFSQNKLVPINKFSKFIASNSFNHLFKTNFIYENNNSQKVLFIKSKTKLKNLTNRNHVRSTENSNIIIQESDSCNKTYNRKHNITQNLSNNSGVDMNYFKNKKNIILFKEYPNKKSQQKTTPAYPKKINKIFLPINLCSSFYFFNSINKNINKKLKPSIKSSNIKSKMPLVKKKIVKSKKLFLSKSCANIKKNIKHKKICKSLDSLKSNYDEKKNKPKINKIKIQNSLANSINSNLIIKPNISTNKILPFKSKLFNKKINNNISLFTTSQRKQKKTRVYIKKEPLTKKSTNDDFVLESDIEFVSKINRINSIKINEFNVNKPNDENLKYTLFKNESEKSSTRPSKIVIGNIEAYKDIIESDKLNNKIEKINGIGEVTTYNDKVKPNKIWNQEKYISLQNVIDYNKIKNINKKKNSILMSYRNINNRRVKEYKEKKMEDLHKKDENYIDSITIINNTETVDDYKEGNKCRIF